MASFTGKSNTSTLASPRPVGRSLVAGSLLAISLGCAVVPSAVAVQVGSSVSAQPSPAPENPQPGDRNIAPAPNPTSDDPGDTPLGEAKAHAIDKINVLPNLTDDQKKEFSGQVMAATVDTQVNQIVANAQRASDNNGDAQLGDARQKAIDAINALPNLTDDQKKEFSGQVMAATVDTQVNQIVAAAQKANDDPGDTPLGEAKAHAIDKINVLPNLTDDQKKEFSGQVMAATVDTQVNQIVANAQRASDNNGDAQLGDARQKAIDAINALPNLSLDQKNAFNSRVQTSAGVDEISSIIKEAENADSQAAARNNNGNQGHNNGGQQNQVSGLDVAKKNAHALIQGMSNLAPWQKQSFQDRINAAATPDQVNKALSEAMGLAANHGGQGANLNTVKDQAHALIQGMSHLSQGQKQSFQDRINAAATPDQVSQILSEAQGLGSGQVGVPAPENGFRTGNAGTQGADHLAEAAGLTLASGVALASIPVIRRRRLSTQRQA